MSTIDKILESKQYTCEYCNKKFAREESLANHDCEIKERYKLLKTNSGKLAFNDYSYWLKKKKKIIKDVDTFVRSRFFNSFINLQSFFSEKGIPDRELYIDFVSSKNLIPYIWSTNIVYDSFIEYYDQHVDDDKKIKITLKTIRKLCKILECKPSELFQNLLPSEIGRLVYQRNIDKDFLILSEKFNDYMYKLKNNSQFLLLESILSDPTGRRKSKETKEKIKSIINSIGL